MDFYASCEALNTMYRIPITILDSVGNPLLVLPDHRDDLVPRQAVEWSLEDFAAQKGDARHPVIIYMEPGYFSGVAILPEDRFCIVGLVSPFQHPHREILQIASVAFAPPLLQEYCNLMTQMPLMNLDQLKALLCLLIRLADGENVQPRDILFVDNTIHYTADLDSAMFHLREEADFHVPLDYETAICTAIETGDEPRLMQCLKKPAQGKVGQMSSSALQQGKYAFVIFATLLTRAAIRGGLPGEEAFSLSDVYCQRMDVQTEQETIQQLTFIMAIDFCRRVAEAKKGNVGNSAVRKCISYIDAHLHEDLHLEELSRECGLCSRSLSSKFKAETGMGIPEYIHRERLREARYLLRSTDYSLAEISGLLNYPTQSYFTQIFRKYEGCTPQQYREKK